MTVAYEEPLNRFPLRAAHLQVLATDSLAIRNRQTGLPDATSRRIIQDLREWRILRRNPGRRDYSVDEHGLQQAVLAAVEERGDLLEALEQASALPVLAALPTTGDPRTLAATGLSPPTIRRQLRSLHERNIIQQRGRDAAVNLHLPATQRLVLAFRVLHARWDDAWCEPADPRGPATHLAIHQRGIEAAWRLRNAEINGPHVVDWAQPFFQPLAPVHQIAYHGPRELTLLDEALLLVRAEADLDFRTALTPGGAQLIDPRIAGLLAAGFTESSIQRPSVRATFDQYRLLELHDALMVAFRRNSGAVMQFRHRYLTEFGIEEGRLA